MSKRPVILGPLVTAFGKLTIPIRAKLSSSFLGIVLLMISVVLIGAFELRAANERASQLIAEQARISAVSNFRAGIRETMLAGALLFAGTQGATEEDSSTSPLSTQLNWLRNTARSNATYARQSNGSARFEEADDFFRHSLEIGKLGSEVIRLYISDEKDAARLLFDNRFSRALRALDREALKVIFQARKSMNDLVKTNEIAFSKSRKVIGIASVLAVLAAIALGYTTSSSIVLPVESIRSALRDVADGDFSAKAEVSNGDELGELAERVNATTKQLGEWNQSLEKKVAEQVETIARTNRLRRFLPKPVADQIIASGDETQLLARHSSEIVVLFADLRGFTAFAESNEPEDVTAALNIFHSHVGPLIERHQGTLERFLGDGLVVLFNAPIESPEPEARAIQMALDMQCGFRPNMEKFQGADHRLGLGVGISKGVASLGQIGFEGRLDYAAIGTVSNVASRLCDLALDTEILVSEKVAQEVKGQFSFVEREPVPLKGLSQPVRYYQVLWDKAV